MVKVSVIITLLNEQATVADLLSALLSQTLLPDEIILVDAGSSDSTVDIIHRFQLTSKRIKLFIHPGNRSVGRNFAISHARSPFIAITDAGCIPHSDWLEKIIQPLSSGQFDVVAGYYRGVPSNLFERCLIPYVLVMPDQIKEPFLPSTRSMAILKSVWKQTDGFNPNLDPGEDYEFSHRLLSHQFRFSFVKAAVVDWLPRRNYSSTVRMFFTFAFSDALSGVPRPRVKLLLFRYFVLLVLLSLALEISFFYLPLLLLLGFYLLWGTLKNYRYVNHPAALLILPGLQLTCDLSVVMGTLGGILVRRGLK